MISTPPFLMLEQPYDQAIGWVLRKMIAFGLQVMVTFDLQIARHAHAYCPCPHHGTQACDCQLEILLIYNGGPGPVTLVAHGHDGRTWLSLVDTPQQPADPRLVMSVQKILVPPSPYSPGELGHAA